MIARATKALIECGVLALVVGAVVGFVSLAPAMLAQVIWSTCETCVPPAETAFMGWAGWAACAAAGLSFVWMLADTAERKG